MTPYQRPTETNELLRSFDTRKEARDYSNGVNMGLSIGDSDAYTSCHRILRGERLEIPRCFVSSTRLTPNPHATPVYYRGGYQPPTNQPPRK